MADAYLEIAERILLMERRPLTARQILDKAHIQRIVPPQLHGRTQHKTLGARLSEDILANRERSSFFRTAPGKFFLTAFLTDDSITDEFKIPIVARRRQRELLRGRTLSIVQEAVASLIKSGKGDAHSTLSKLSKADYRYLTKPSTRSADDLIVWAFVLVTKGDQVLTYRHGRYREDRDTFLQRRSIGFFSPVSDWDHDLFSRGDLGIVAAGIKAIVMDLDLPNLHGNEADYQNRATLDCLIATSSASDITDLLAVVRFECPIWFEPLQRRLAINDLRWMKLVTPVNNIEDFDPWSQEILEWVQKK